MEAVILYHVWAHADFGLKRIYVCVPRGKAATAVFNIDWATKATAGLKPRIENSIGGGRVGGGLVGLKN